MGLELHHAHPWVLSPADAAAVQRRLAPLVRQEPLIRPVELVAGVDMSVRQGRARAAAVVLALPNLVRVDQAVWEGDLHFPYLPGLLSFRELPPLLAALAQLHHWPDLIMADAQGVAHPRRFGLACHLGLLLELPVLGAAKSLLVGSHGPLGEQRGEQVPLCDGDERIGSAVRTRSRVRPLFVSVGHRLLLAEAVALVLACTSRYRLPEPIRQAHLLSRAGQPQPAPRCALTHSRLEPVTRPLEEAGAMTEITHLTMEQLEAGLERIRQSPREEGRLELIVRRPAVGQRDVLEVGHLDEQQGLEGDNWQARGSSLTADGTAHPEMQLNIMNARAIALVAQEKSRWPLAGDQLYVDFDLSAANLPPGSRLAIGAALIEVTPLPHNGCQKFVSRFGLDAMLFVNSPVGKELHLRGINARVVRSGPIQVGDRVRKI